MNLRAFHEPSAVRPSPGAAMFEAGEALGYFSAAGFSDLPAPEDGRTPVQGVQGAKSAENSLREPYPLIRPSPPVGEKVPDLSANVLPWIWTPPYADMPP
jgi:hypothetical protein